MSEVLPSVVLDVDDNEVVIATPRAELPAVSLPTVPSSALLWSRVLVVASILVTLFTLDQFSLLMANFWLFQSLSYQDVFWTNFKEGADLYVAGFVLYILAFAVPAYMHNIGPRARHKLVQAGMLVA
jgi:hypothetical protein